MAGKDFTREYSIAEDWGERWVDNVDELSAIELTFATAVCLGNTYFRDAFVEFHEHESEKHGGVPAFQNIPPRVFYEIWSKTSDYGNAGIPPDHFDSVYKFIEMRKEERQIYARLKRAQWQKEEWEAMEENRLWTESAHIRELAERINPEGWKEHEKKNL